LRQINSAPAMAITLTFRASKAEMDDFLSFSGDY
jgi:hypothetical protein